MENKTGIKTEDLEILIGVLKKNVKITEVILFGSRSKGTHSPGSDVDISLKGTNINLDDILDFQIALDDLDFPYKTDLIIYDRITEPALQNHIERVGKVLYSRQRDGED